MRFAPKSLSTTILIIALLTTGPLSTDMYLPALPDIRRSFGVGTASVQMTLSIFLFGLAFAQLIVGPLSDKFGRRPVLIWGMSLYTLTSILCAWANTIDVLIVARFFQAVGVCSGAVVSRSMVRDIYGQDESARMLAHISTAIAVAPLLAPLIGGQLSIMYGWPSVFIVMAFLGFVLMLITTVALPETNQWKAPDALNPLRFLSNYKSLLKDRNYRNHMLASTFNFSGLFAFISGSSFVLIETLGMSVENFGFAFGFVVVGFMAGSQISGRLVKRLGIGYLVNLGGTIAMTAGIIGLGAQIIFTPSVFGIITPMAFYLASVGFILPNAMAGAIGPHPNMAGAASALLGFVKMASAATAGVLVGYFHDGTTIPMMMIVAVFGILTKIYARKVR